MLHQETEKDGFIQWRVHPILENKGKSILLILVLGFILFIIHLNFPEPIWVIFSFVILLCSLRKFFLPTTYELSQKGVSVSFLNITHKIPWERFKRYEVGKKGLFLSPFPKPNRIENFRGTFLIFGKNRDEVIEFVKARFPK